MAQEPLHSDGVQRWSTFLTKDTATRLPAALRRLGESMLSWAMPTAATTFWRSLASSRSCERATIWFRDVGCPPAGVLSGPGPCPFFTAAGETLCSPGLLEGYLERRSMT